MLYTNLISCGISQLGVGIGIPLLLTKEEKIGFSSLLFKHLQKQKVLLEAKKFSAS